MKNLTVSEAEEILREHFWEEVLGGEIKDESVAIKLFDMAVNMGVPQAMKLVQRALNLYNKNEAVAVDGKMGLQTLGALNDASGDELMKYLCSQSIKFYLLLVKNNPASFCRYKKGWEKRGGRIPETEDKVTTMAFCASLKYTLKEEGGVSDSSTDKGDPTKYGISLSFYQSIYPNATRDDILNLTLPKAQEIYRQYFWEKLQGDKIEDEVVAAKLFDMAVHMGVPKAVQLLQEILNTPDKKVVVDGDGIMGPQTLGELNAVLDSNLVRNLDLVYELCRQSKAYYLSIVKKDPTQKKYEKGWLSRALAIPRRAERSPYPQRGAFYGYGDEDVYTTFTYETPGYRPKVFIQPPADAYALIDIIHGYWSLSPAIKQKYKLDYFFGTSMWNWLAQAGGAQVGGQGIFNRIIDFNEKKYRSLSPVQQDFSNMWGESHFGDWFEMLYQHLFPSLQRVSEYLEGLLSGWPLTREERPLVPLMKWFKHTIPLGVDPHSYLIWHFFPRSVRASDANDWLFLENRFR